MKKYFVLFAMAVPALFWSCSSEENDPDPEEQVIIEEPEITNFAEPIETSWTINLTPGQTFGISGYNELGWSTFLGVLEDSPAENHSISPVSINSALSLLASVGDDGDARRQLAKCLGFDDMAELDDFNHQLLSFLPSESNGVELSLANALWLDKPYTPAEELVSSVAERFGATVQSVDFSDPRTVDLINGWVKFYTRERILKIIEEFQGRPEFCITNALYFKGDWQKAFDEESSFNGTFKTYEGNSTVRYMDRLDELKYSQSDDFVMASLPFRGEKIVMDLVLPTDDKVPSYDAYSALCSAASTDSVVLKIPKFEIHTDYPNMAPLIAKNGVPYGPYNFTRLGIPANLDCRIDLIVHKMFVSVSETGAEAAAATEIIMFGAPSPDEEQTSEPKYKYVTLDKPFYYVIREVEHNIILGIGHITAPNVVND